MIVRFLVDSNYPVEDRFFQFPKVRKLGYVIPPWSVTRFFYPTSLGSFSYSCCRAAGSIVFKCAETSGAGMKLPARIALNPEVMGGRPCIRGTRVTVGVVVGMLAQGHDRAEILRLYPYLESDDIDAALTYAAWRADEQELPVATG